jgi:tetratricopeptide (TPR) repeat protein
LLAVQPIYTPSYEHDDGSHSGAFTEETRREAAAEKYLAGLDILRQIKRDGTAGDEGAQLGKVLPYLRSACRLEPNNSTLWNDLGVVEMRVGLHEKARLRFGMALHVDGTNTDARSNLALLRRLYGRDEFFESTQELRPTNHQDLDIKHRVRNLTRIAIGDLGKEENKDFLSGKLPCIITGAMTPERGYNPVSLEKENSMSVHLRLISLNLL